MSIHLSKSVSERSRVATSLMSHLNKGLFSRQLPWFEPNFCSGVYFVLRLFRYRTNKRTMLVRYLERTRKETKARYSSPCMLMLYTSRSHSS
jgi:hypothetical protein